MLEEFEEWLLSLPDDRPMLEVIADGTMRFNRIHSDGAGAHRDRMELILHTPALRAQRLVQNAEWAGVVSRYTARRLGASPDELGPQLIGQITLGAANAAYEQWLRDESSDLGEVVHRAFEMVLIAARSRGEAGNSVSVGQGRVVVHPRRHQVETELVAFRVGHAAPREALEPVGLPGSIQRPPSASTSAVERSRSSTTTSKWARFLPTFGSGTLWRTTIRPSRFAVSAVYRPSS